QDLVRTVHKMNCFFRIWKMPYFMCIDPSKKLVPLPISVQAQLRRFARKALDRLEHDVFKMLDDCLGQQGSPKAEERVAFWFRTKKSIELSFDWLDSISSANVSREDKAQIRQFGQQLLSSRRNLYDYVKSSANKESSADRNDVDEMLWTFVVEHEVKKLNARKRTSKGLSSKMKSSRQMGNEFDDE
ncbi:hypothetical protein E4U43_004935, partial [Claviceps pusilla]